MREAIAYGMVIGMSLAFLWHFSNIVRYGKHFIQEPNTLILASEIALISSCLVFAIISLIKLVRSS